MWFALLWLFDRYRLGPDYKKRRKAERSVMRNAGFGPFFFGYAWSMMIYLVIEFGVSGVSIPFGTALFTAMAVGRFIEASWIFYKLRSVS